MKKSNKNIVLKALLWLQIPIFLASCNNGCTGSVVYLPAATTEDQIKASEVLVSINQCLDSYKEQMQMTERVINDLGNLCFKTTEEQNKLLDLELEVSKYIFNIRDVQNDKSAVEARAERAKDNMQNLYLAYSQIQEMLVACQTNNFLNEHNPADINYPFSLKTNGVLDKDKNFKLFKLLMGDVLGQETKGGQDEIIQVRNNYLKDLQKVLAHTYIKNDAQAHPCRGIEGLPFTETQAPRADLSSVLVDRLASIHEGSTKLSEKLADHVGAADKFYEEFKLQLDELKTVGDSMTVPGGSKKHPMLYQITKNAGDNYTFRVYNSGEGIGTYHAQAVDGYETKFLPFMELTDVKKEDLLKKSLTSMIVAMSKDDTFEVADFYEKVLPTIGGKPSSNKYTIDDLKPLLDQNGESTHLSLSWLLSSATEQMVNNGLVTKEDDFSTRLQELFNLKLLNDFKRSIDTPVAVGTPQEEKAKESLKTEIDRTLKKAMSTMFAESINNAKSSSISSGFLGVMAEVGEDISKDIANNQKNKTVIPRNNQIADVLLGKPSEELAMSAPPPVQNPVDIGGTVNAVAVNVMPRPAGLNSASIKLIDDNYQGNNFIQVLNFIEQLVLNLPFSKDNWSDNSIAIDENIGFIKRVHLRYIQSIAGAATESKITTTQFLTAVKLLALGDMLNQKLPNSVGKLPPLQQPIINEILAGDFSFIEIKDPRWFEVLNDLRAYFKDAKKESFFDLNSQPAGGRSDRTVWYDTDLDSLRAYKDVDWAIKYLEAQPNKSLLKGSPADLKAFEHKFTYSSYGTLSDKGRKFSFVNYQFAKFIPDPNPNAYYSSPKVQGERTDIKNLDDEPLYPKFVSRDHRSLSIGIRKQAAEDLAKNSSDPMASFQLPQRFYDLRQISYGTNFLLTGQIQVTNRDNLLFKFKSQSMIEVYTTQVGKIGFDNYDRLPPSTWPRNTQPFKSSSSPKEISVEKYTDKTGLEITYNSPSWPASSPYANLKKAEMPFGAYNEDTDVKSLNSIYKKGSMSGASYKVDDDSARQRRLPNNLILTTDFRSTLGIEKLSLEHIRALLTMSGVKQLQLFDTLAYFSSDSSWLSIPEYQRLFEKLMFEPGFLLDQLKISDRESEKIITRLAKYCADNIKRYSANKKTKELVFFARMNELFKLQIQFAQKSDYQVEPLSANKFVDSYKALTDYIPHLKLTDEIGLVYLVMADLFSYSDRKLLENDVINLLSAKAYIGSKEIGKEWRDTYLEDRVKNILVEKGFDIREQLLANKDNILDRVTSNVLGGALVRTGEWQNPPAIGALTNGLYSAQFLADTVQIDTVNGRVYMNNSLGKKLPPIDIKEIYRVFGDKAPDVTAQPLQNSWWRFDDPKTKKTEIQIDNGKILGLRYGEYQLLDKPMAASLLGNEWLKKDYKNAFDPDSKEWLQNDYKYWMRTDSLANERIIEIREGDKTLYTAKLEFKEGKWKLVNVKDTKDRDRFIATQDEPPMSFFKDIEPRPEFIKVWTTGDGANKRLEEISLPRLNLSFRLLPPDPDVPADQQKGKLDCAYNGKYQLADEDEQSPADLGDEYNFVVCKLRKDNKQLPKYIALMALPESISNDSANRLLRYEFQNDLTEKAIPKSEAAIYYLALRKYKDGHYQRARDLLTSSAAEIALLKKSHHEDEIIRKILIDSEKDPQALAVRMLAASLLFAQKDNFNYLNEYPNNTELKNLKNDYVAYLSEMKLLNGEWINFYQEYSLANNLVKEANGTSKGNDSIIYRRLMTLKKLHPSLGKGIEDLSVEKVERNNDAIKSNKVKLNMDFDSLKLLAQTPLNDFIPLGSITNLDQILADDSKFGLFYDIAVGKELDADQLNVARNILFQITGVAEAEIDAMDLSKLRSEFLPIFALASISNTTTTAAERAKYFEQVALKASTMPSLSELLEYFARYDAKESDRAKEQLRTSAEHSKNFHAGRRQPADLFVKLNKITEEKEALKSEIERDLIAPFKQDKVTVSAFESEVDYKAKKSAIDPKPASTNNKSSASMREISQRIDDPFSEPILADGKLTIYFDQEKANSKHINDIKTSLIDKLKRVSKAPENIKKTVKVLTDSIEKYAKERANEESYRIKDTKIGKLENVLASKIDEMKDSVAKSKKLINRSVEKAGNTELYSPYKRVGRLAQLDPEVDIDHMIYLLLTNNLEQLQKYAVEKKSTGELEYIKDSLVKYLLEATYLQHLENCQDALENLDSGLTDLGKAKSESERDAKEKEIVSLSNNVVNLLKEKRHYKYFEHIEYLVFEYFIKLHIRKLQVDALNKLEIKNGAVGNEKALGPVLEIIMGFGKTKVLLPLISALNTKNDMINMVMIPEALLVSMSKELRDLIGKGFGRSIDVVEIERKQNLNKDKLINLYSRLERAKIEKRTIITTNSSIQSLFLSYINLMYSYQKEVRKSPADKVRIDEEINLFVKIFVLLKKYGLLTIDEVDMALDVLKGHQFAVGDRIPINQDIASTAFAFYRQLAINPKVKNLFTLEFIKGSNGDTLTEVNYANNKARLVEGLISNELFQDSEYLKKSFDDYISVNAQRALLTKYLLSSNMNDRVALMSNIDRTTSLANEKQRAYVKNVATTLYDEINQVFPLTAGRKKGIHYGALPYPVKEELESEQEFENRLKFYDETNLIAVPYNAGVPSLRSAFGSDLESINYSIQLALIDLDFTKHVTKERDWLTFEDLKNLTDAQRDNLRKRMLRLFGDEKPDSIDMFKNGGERFVNLAASELKKPERIDVALDLIKTYALPQLKTYKDQLFTNAQIYSFLFNRVSGFSGTLWSVDTFPDIFKREQKSAETTAKTFMLLWEQYHDGRLNKGETGIKAIKDVPASELVNAIYEDVGADGKPFDGSLMDLGGMLRSESNKGIAEKIEKIINVNAVDKDNGVVFYLDGELVVLDANGNIVDQSASAVDRNKRVAYWDKQHTTGSDIKLRITMKGRMTFDQHVFSRDIEQTAYRFRQLAEGQQIDQYAVLENDLQLMKGNMREILRDNSMDLTNFDVGDLLLYGVIYQENKLGDLLHRALKYKMGSAVVEKVVAKMFTETPEQAAKTYGTFSSLFTKSLIKEPHTYQGFPTVIESKSSVLSKDRQAILSDEIKRNITAWGVLGAVENTINKLTKDISPFLPDNLKGLSSASGLEVEIQMQRETQTQTEVQTETIVPNANYTPYDVFGWKVISRSKNYFEPIEVREFGNKDIAKEVNENRVRPLFNVKEYLKNTQAKLEKYLDENLLASLNFAPVHAKGSYAKRDKYQFKFFDIYQKSNGNVLVLVDIQSGTDDSNRKVSVVLIDNNDAKDLDNYLKEVREDTANDYKVALYSVGIGNNIDSANDGIFRQDVNANDDQIIDVDELKNNQKFIDLITQVKFLNGYTSYTEEEKLSLDKWFTKWKFEGARFLSDLFRKQIIKYKFEKQKQLPGSDIYYLFLKHNVNE